MKQLNTLWASWLKVFLVAVLVKFLDYGGDLFDVNLVTLRHLLQAGVVATIPVIINYLNPTDTRYGSHKDMPDEKINLN